MKEFFYRVKRLGWLKNRFRFRVAKWSLPIRRFQRLIADPCHQEVSRYATLLIPPAANFASALTSRHPKLLTG